MTGNTKALLVCFFVVACFGTLRSAGDPASADIVAALDRVSASIDRLGQRTDKRVEIAAAVLSVRGRKADRLDAELRDVGKWTDQLRSDMTGLQSQIENLTKMESTARPGEAEFMRLSKQQLEAQVRDLETKIRDQEERRVRVQAELDQEGRSLARLEAILDDWLKQQK